MYEGKSISKLQMDIEVKQTRVLIWKILLFFNIISLYIEALVPSFHKPLKTSNIKFLGLLSDPRLLLLTQNVKWCKKRCLDVWTIAIKKYLSRHRSFIESYFTEKFPSSAHANRWTEPPKYSEPRVTATPVTVLRLACAIRIHLFVSFPTSKWHMCDMFRNNEWSGKFIAWI
jgi:hypothetical protein